MASIAAHWLTCEAHESVFVTQRVKTGASVRFAAKPIRRVRGLSRFRPQLVELGVRLREAFAERADVLRCWRVPGFRHHPPPVRFPTGFRDTTPGVATPPNRQCHPHG